MTGIPRGCPSGSRGRVHRRERHGRWTQGLEGGRRTRRPAARVGSCKAARAFYTSRNRRAACRRSRDCIAAARALRRSTRASRFSADSSSCRAAPGRSQKKPPISASLELLPVDLGAPPVGSACRPSARDGAPRRGSLSAPGMRRHRAHWSDLADPARASRYRCVLGSCSERICALLIDRAARVADKG